MKKKNSNVTLGQNGLNARKMDENEISRFCHLLTSFASKSNSSNIE